MNKFYKFIMGIFGYVEPTYPPIPPRAFHDKRAEQKAFEEKIARVRALDEHYFHCMDLHIEIQRELKADPQYPFKGKTIVTASIDRKAVSPADYGEILVSVRNSIRELEKFCTSGSSKDLNNSL